MLKDLAFLRTPKRRIWTGILLVVVIAAVFAVPFFIRDNPSENSQQLAIEEWQKRRPEIRAQLSWLESAIQEGHEQNQVNRIYVIIYDALKESLSESALKDRWTELEPKINELGNKIRASDQEASELIQELKQALAADAKLKLN